ncbi:MAG: serine hydrolase [Salinisphaera sp.]|jgi:CubicO group peptidase (beta-lactamase class C family)|nr:serine hydrolase [Salinisphaera sp.]
MNLALPGTRLIQLPAGPLAPITRVDTGSEVDSRKAGLAAQDVDAIWQATEALYRSRVYPALTMCLRRRGHVLLHRSIGYARGVSSTQAPGPNAVLAAPDTPVCLFSASKAIIGLLIHKLAEEGGIDLDKPVSHYVPAFAREGKSRTTIAQVLSHYGGFPSFIAGKQSNDPKTLTDWDECVRRICDQPPDDGVRRMAYHAITGGFILGEVIRRVTGAPMIDYLDSRLRKPLGMRYFTYGLDGRSRSRVAENHLGGQPVRFPVSKWAREALSTGFDDVVDISNRDFFMDAVIPSGNLYATADELSRFYQMLLDGGVWQGKRVFKAETIARAIRPATPVRFDRSLKIPMRYSEGLMLGMNPVGMYGPMCGDAYGHLGFMNILGWADPARDLSVSLLTTGKAILGGHLIPLARLLSVINCRCQRP